MSAAGTRLLRLALIQMTQDLTAVLSEDQRAWLRARLIVGDPLTTTERRKLQPVVLGWAQTRLAPATVAKLTACFEEHT